MLVFLSSYRQFHSLPYREAFINVIVDCIQSRIPYDEFIAQRESLEAALGKQISSVRTQSSIKYFKTDLKRGEMKELYEQGECF
jgi:hypothetical protein